MTNTITKDERKAMRVTFSRPNGHAIAKTILALLDTLDAAEVKKGWPISVDELAQKIRTVDGENTLGAGALAEALHPLYAAPLAAEPVKVKPLEWAAVTDQIPKRAFAAYTAFSRWLIVCEFLSMNHMVYRFNSADYETLEAAKAAAQSDYEARIRSALVSEKEAE